LKTVEVGKGRIYSTANVRAVARDDAKIVIAPEVMALVRTNFDAVMQMAGQDAYGLTTGVADLSTEHPTGTQDEIQKGILLSHAVGTGENLPDEVVRAAIFSRLLVLSKGYSGVSPELLTFMADLLNHDIVPVVPSLGSIGASDLTILAGIFVILCDSGKVKYQGEIYGPQDAFKRAGIAYPKQLRSREGLALINGNDCAVGMSALVLEQLREYLDGSLKAAALTFEGRTGTNGSFAVANQRFKPYAGQLVASKQLETALHGSAQITDAYQNKEAVFLQDPPSFKTVTQVLGAASDAFQIAEEIITIELNGVTDNPLLVNEGSVVTPVSSGNYHAGQLATTLDQLALVTAQVAQASVARIQILLNDRYSEGLPKYLVEDSTNNSGFMICAYTAQSVLSEMKALLYPRSIMSSTVANGWEDISSNATNAAMNTQKVANLAHEVLAIEQAVAIQAMALRKHKGKAIEFGKTTGEIFDRCNNALTEANIKLPVQKDAQLRSYISAIRTILDSNR
jgi:histidine ammonia-lyase